MSRDGHAPGRSRLKNVFRNAAQGEDATPFAGGWRVLGTDIYRLVRNHTLELRGTHPFAVERVKSYQPPPVWVCSHAFDTDAPSERASHCSWQRALASWRACVTSDLLSSSASLFTSLAAYCFVPSSLSLLWSLALKLQSRSICLSFTLCHYHAIVTQ